MRVIHFSTSKDNGGAALAASELSEALSRRISSSLATQISGKNLLEVVVIGIKRKISRLISVFDPDARHMYASYAVFSSRAKYLLKKSQTDIVHLHWVQGEYLSIEDIGNAEAPIVWTLHDGWQFLNGPHHDPRYLTTAISDSKRENANVISRWIRYRKHSSWTKKMYLVAPSQWIANQAAKASINKHNSVSVIPNMINNSVFYRRSKSEARAELGLHDNEIVMLVGSLASTSDPIKGFNLLIEALEYLSVRQYRFKCLYIGKHVDIPEVRDHVHSMGSVRSREEMALIYAACDVVCVPSRIETHSMVASEAISCGRPVAAFNVGGNPEIIEHKASGYLAEAFNVESLAQGILFCIERLNGQVSDEAYRRHQNKHNPESILDQYIRLYSEIMQS